MRTLRRLAVPVAATGALGAAGLVALGALGLLRWADALLLLALAALGALVAGLGLLVVLLRRAVLGLSAALDTQTRMITDTLGRDRLETVTAVDGVRSELTRLRTRELPRAVGEITKAVAVQGRHDYEQQVAWTELRDFLRPAAFMPPLRGWAASPDVLRLLVRTIDAARPELVVECGSGASSIWMGYALRRAGTGRLVALEHDEHYAGLTRDLVAAHGLDDLVQVRHAPLTEWTAQDGEPARPWYDPAAVADLEDIGLLFVDGPPEATAALARYPAVPALLARLAPDAVVVLDDAGREGERSAGDRWLAEVPGLLRREEAAEKGAHVFTRSLPEAAR